jgi:hypothetical protein
MKATGKERYHNNFGCYGFVPCSDVSYLVPTFRKRWLGAWMEEWFYVKNNLIERKDINGITNALSGLASASEGRLLRLGTISKHARRLSTMFVPLLAQET